jgi:hypothetical protein
MGRTNFEVAQVIERFGARFVKECTPNTFTMRTLDALSKCRTSALGGHKDRCDSCGKERFSYNSCRNRHCPKCQATRQAIWAEDRMREALDVKYFHVVFTLPEELNKICLLDSRWFYGNLFTCAWETLRTFGYSHYGGETGALCLLHTWGQTLSLHPHIHCLVPAAGITLDGRLKRITKDGDFLYPVEQLSQTFRGKILEKIKRRLKKKGILKPFQSMLDKLWKKDWVVYCKTPMGNVQQIVQYMGRYSHRVAIGILGAKQKKNLKSLLVKNKKPKKKTQNQVLASETKMERIIRLTGFDPFQCPFCKKGIMHTIETLPRIRAPSVLFPNPKTSC